MDNQELDIAMEGDIVENGHQENGFAASKLVDQLDDFDLPDEMEDIKSESESSISSPPPAPRKGWRPTGCCYDDRMKLHANADFSKDPSHPEDPRRIEVIMKEFKSAGLIFTGSDSELSEILKTSPTSWMYRIAAREATIEEICTVHTVAHYRWVESLSSMTSAQLRELSAQLDDGRRSLYVGNLTFEASLISAGGAIESCKSVVAGHVKNAIAVIRPPGHHAEHNQSLGFCLFNNVPIAARVCQADFPDTCRKILILDWDVHHGNGIQNIFYDDPNVLYISIHVYQGGIFYPGRPDEEGIPDGGLENCGVGPGIGKNVNIGWHDQGMGDGAYMAAFQRIVMPIAQEFDPDLVIISAGFDAAAGDELGGCFVTPACYSHMTHMLMSLADGKVAVCLEGGYNLRALSRSALAVAKTLMGEPPMRMTIPPIQREAALVLNKVKEYQAPYWECMRAGQVNTKDIQAVGGVRLNDVIRAYQRKTLANQYKMVSLFVQRERLSKSFEDQVLVTRRLFDAKRILFIIHDPPELLALPDPVDNKVESHNAWLTDGVMPYIDWAIANDFGVIDANIPMSITKPKRQEDEIGFIERPREIELQEQIKELVCYLWDNYLESYDSSEIVLMGVGDSYLGVKMLLTSRECKSKIRCVLNFVTGSLRPIKSETDPTLSSWYKSHSHVYVAPDHACWEDEIYAGKVKRNRFGMVIRSDVVGLNRMMARYKDSALAWVMSMVGSGEA